MHKGSLVHSGSTPVGAFHDGRVPTMILSCIGCACAQLRPLVEVPVSLDQPCSVVMCRLSEIVNHTEYTKEKCCLTSKQQRELGFV